MPINSNIVDIVDKAMAGQGLPEEDIATLWTTNAYSAEASYVRWGGFMLSRKATDGVAEVHAQIGMDASACPKNCQFCSFAACNGLRPEKLEMPKDEVIEYARAYDRAGVNLMCLMVTSAYDFDQFCDMGASVREVIDPEMPLMANIDDFSYEQALKLKESGFDCVYHVVHMGEGKITSIKPETRIQTIHNAQQAGLTVSSCVEPIGPEHTPEEVAKRFKQVLELDPVSSGAGLRIPVPGSPFANDPRKGRIDWAYAAAVFRLSVGLSVRLAGSTHLASDSGANYGWAEVGTNPRDTTTRTDKESGVGQSMYETKKGFIVDGWHVLEGPSQGWRL